MTIAEMVRHLATAYVERQNIRLYAQLRDANRKLAEMTFDQARLEELEILLAERDEQHADAMTVARLQQGGAR